MNIDHNISLLRLLHLADSALPIGATPHSFGLETLAFESNITPPTLYHFFHDSLHETGLLDAVFLRAAWTCADMPEFDWEWARLNEQYAAFKPARESRAASQTLGRRLLELVLNIDAELTLLRRALSCPVCHSTAFGLAARVLEIDADAATLAFLHQSLAGLLSACQRLMPLGQRQAGQLLWALKPTLVEIMEASRDTNVDDLHSFTPLLDLASMRHPTLQTRLFIS
jgi:urease accessory protein